MKSIFLFLAASLFSSFTSPKTNDIGGIWMGFYRSDSVREKMVLKFNNRDTMEMFTAGFDDPPSAENAYHLYADSVSFTYLTPQKQKIIMEGRFNVRKNFITGTWKMNDKVMGIFYLEKQKMEERLVQP